MFSRLVIPLVTFVLT